MNGFLSCPHCGRARPRLSYRLTSGEWSDRCEPCRSAEPKEPLVDWCAFAEQLLYGHARDYHTLTRAERVTIARTALECAQYHQTRAGEAQAA